MSYDDVLREDADRFVTTVAVVAQAEGRTNYEVANRALTDALARLTEIGVLGSDEE